MRESKHWEYVIGNNYKEGRIVADTFREAYDKVCAFLTDEHIEVRDEQFVSKIALVSVAED